MHALLRDGHGGLSWAGLEPVCAWLGVEDLDLLMHRLMVIKCYRRPDEGAGAGEE